ncbi:MAG TPA: ArsI/CadI family heavy metal resistance metalloenzyme [Planctomycetaceae bacterium]|nr:ArsI/CadI family heavy metal resistance metalloenzyme [Planctomycetaceae bacterium]
MTTDAPIRFHISLNVSNLARSVEFYQSFFGCPPAKHRSDYAKFEVDAPPLVLSLEPHPHQGGGAFNHAGLRLSDSAQLVEMQRRLELAGFRTQREEGVECCYARQTKFWLRDPDQNLWEVYTLDEDIEHRGAGQAGDSLPPVEAPAAKIQWSHRMGQSFPEQLPFESGTVFDIRLQGTFNVPVAPAEQDRILSETFRVLQPGGSVLLHILTAEQPVTTKLSLPGLAASVSHVPVRRQLMDAVEAAGFVGLHLEKFRGSACFVHEGIELRETMLIARRPAVADEGDVLVVYRGPFAEIRLDDGTMVERGTALRLSSDVWQTLTESGVADQFTQLPTSPLVSLPVS